MKLLVLDGNSILNRAFYGIKLLTTKSGLYTNGIHGFLSILQKLEEEVRPDAVAIAFDLPAPTFRHKRYAGYKANRHGMPDELAQQLPTLKELLTLLGYRLVTCEGFEADDILGTLSAACTESRSTCVIATGDRDSLQLVGPYVSVRLASTKYGRPSVTLYDEMRVYEEYGVEPKELIEVKALQGDTSDCIPGVRGIGPKGAGELIQKYHSIDYIYDHLHELDVKPAMRKRLEEGKDSAYLSHELGTIVKNAPIDTTLADYVKQPPQREAAAALLTKLELFKMREALGLDHEELPPAAEAEAKAPAQWTLVLHADAGEIAARCKAQGACYVTGQFSGRQLLWLSVADGERAYLFEDPDDCRTVLRSGAPLFTFDAKPLFGFLGEAERTAPLPLAFDALLAAYLLNPSAKSYAFARLCEEYGVPLCENITCEGLSPADLARTQDLLPGANACALPELCKILSEKIEGAGERPLLRDIEQPLARVLAHMEEVGFAVDRDAIAQYGKELERQEDALRADVFEKAGYTFNVNSPKQLGEALFGKLGLPHGKKTKNGWSTSASVLEELRYDHPVVESVLQYRAVAKLKSTYCDGLLKVLGPDGRIHSNFNQTETRTGRISSTEPNLQNIPVRTPQGRELRRFFIAKPGCVLIDADYSQIELRLLAHISGDPAMQKAFCNGEDIHRATAAQVFHMPEDMVTPLMRARAKAVNFGIVYGIGAYSLSRQLHVSLKEADDYIKSYLAHYAGIDAYMHRVVEEAREKGFAQTMFGRRRYLPELKSSNHNLRAFGERVARNMPIQGAAADIIKIAMIHVEDRLQKEGLQARLILQVHDELIVEAPESEATQAARLLQEEMEGAAQLSVPLVADAAAGKTWYEAKA